MYKIATGKTCSVCSKVGTLPARHCSVCVRDLCEECFAAWHSSNPILKQHESETTIFRMVDEMKIINCSQHDHMIKSRMECPECHRHFTLEGEETSKAALELNQKWLLLQHYLSQERRHRKSRRAVEKLMHRQLALIFQHPTFTNAHMKSQLLSHSVFIDGDFSRAPLAEPQSKGQALESYYAGKTARPIGFSFPKPVIVKEVTLKYNCNTSGTARFRADRVRLTFYSDERSSSQLSTAEYDLPWKPHDDGETKGHFFASAQVACISDPFPLEGAKRILLECLKSTQMNVREDDCTSAPHYSFNTPFEFRGIALDVA